MSSASISSSSGYKSNKTPRGGPPPSIVKSSSSSGGSGGSCKKMDPCSSSSSSSCSSEGGVGGAGSSVWINPRFTHSVTSLVGVNVLVETSNNETYEGILRTMSNCMDIVLLQSHKVDKNNPNDIRQETLVEKRVLDVKDIVRLYAAEVDLDFACRKAFQTDYQIAGRSNGPSLMRELEEWKPEDGDCDSKDELEENLESDNGWKVEDMFAKNEKNYGIKSTFKENLEGYTCQLSTEGKDTVQYKQREAKAAEMARKIEENSSSSAAVEVENGENEEDAFSAVHRPSSPPTRVSVSGGTYNRSQKDSSTEENSGNKYVLPSRRIVKGTPPRQHNDRDNDGDSQHPHHRRRHSHHHYAGSNNSMTYYKKTAPPSQHDEKPSHSYSNRNNASYNNNYSPRGEKRSDYNNDGKRLIKTSSSNNNRAKESYQGSPDFKKKEDPKETSTTPPSSSPDIGDKTPPGDAEKGGTPESAPKPRVHFSDQSPSTIAPTTAAVVTSTAAASSSPPASVSSSAPAKPAGLNPNAKEFVLNPNAKMFTPTLARPPLATTPSRPQTPATPVGAPGTYTAQPYGYVNIPTSTQQTRNRAQRDYQRADLTSPMQVAAATGSPLVPVSYPHMPFQTQATATPQHGVVMRFPHNFALAASHGASSLEPMSLQQQQQPQQWAAATTQAQQPPPQGTPQQQQSLTGTPPAPSHTPSPGPQVIFPLAITQQPSQGNQQQAPPVSSLSYHHPHHHHPSNAQQFAAASPGGGHYPPNLLALPPTAVLSGHPPMIHPPMMPSQQGQHVPGGMPMPTYIAPPTVPGHQNHLLHSHLTQ